MKGNRAAWWIATVFGCGLAPVAPGTAGSLFGIASAYFLTAVFGLPPFCLLILALGFVPIGFWSAGQAARLLGKEDPSQVVIDEVLGQWVTLAGAVRLNWRAFFFAFLLFRLFDIWKPPPVRQFERLPGGQGIVADDLMAGLYGALVLFGLGWFNLY